MPAPTVSTPALSTWSGTSAATETTASLSWSSSDLIVVLGATEDNTRTLATPTATGLTFSLVGSTNTGSNGKVYVWSATAGSSSSGAISATTDGSNTARGLAAWAVTGSDGLGTPVTSTGSSAMTSSVTRAQANSFVLMALVDWNAVNDTAVSTLPSGATQHVAQYVASRATFFVLEWGDQGATGTTSYGIDSSTYGGTAKIASLVVEVKGTAGGGGGGATQQTLGLQGVGS